MEAGRLTNGNGLFGALKKSSWVIAGVASLSGVAGTYIGAMSVDTVAIKTQSNTDLIRKNDERYGELTQKWTVMDSRITGLESLLEVRMTTLFNEMTSLRTDLKDWRGELVRRVERLESR